MVGSRKTISGKQKPTTVLERLGGKPKLVVRAGKKASSRVQRKARLNPKVRAASEG